jgi:hypothetical protein
LGLIFSFESIRPCWILNHLAEGRTSTNTFARFKLFFVSVRVGAYLVPLLSLLFSTRLANGTIVEFSIDKAPLPGLSVGTCGYSPTEVEKIWFDQLSEDDQATIQLKSDEIESRFQLAGHDNQFVSWFGIVRAINRDPEGKGATLLIQNTYSDGLTDCHTQTVEISGAGDFEIMLSELPDDIIPLVLVRAYGFVTGKQEQRPVINADYIRVWHWFQFNFMDFGEDHSNPEWKKRQKLPEGETIYHIGVSRRYYEERLGPTSEEWDEIAAFHRGQTELEFERLGLDLHAPAANYTPTEWEQPYFDRLRKEDRITVESKSGETEHASFRLTDRVHQFVSWFGIVREISPRLGKRGGTLLIENKYFKGSGDERLQTVSIRGAGNFTADVTNLAEELEPLTLVRVYGTVVREEGGVPVIEVAFLRGWHWSQFNFDDYGDGQGDPRWTKAVQLKPGEKVCETKVSADYYINRLGPTPEEAQRIRDFFKWQEQDEKATRELKQLPEETNTITPSPSP